MNTYLQHTSEEPNAAGTLPRERKGVNASTMQFKVHEDTVCPFQQNDRKTAVRSQLCTHSFSVEKDV